MKDKTIADLFVVIHLLWILLILASLPLVLMFPTLKNMALSLVGINLFSWFIWKDCPLFIWENSYRKKYNPDKTYEGAFISHYLKKYFNVSVAAFTVKISLYSYAMALVLVSLI